MTEAAIFNFDPTAVQVALGSFEKGRRTFEVTSVKGYSRTKKDASGAPKFPEEKVLGIYFGLKCIDPTHRDQRQIYNGMVHTEGSVGFTKQFLMAALGYNPRDMNSENDFNKTFAGIGWSIDFETGACGETWMKAKGRLVSLETDIQVDTNGNPQQKFSNPQPVTA
jgi:hypothetical protein